MIDSLIASNETRRRLVWRIYSAVISASLCLLTGGCDADSMVVPAKRTNDILVLVDGHRGRIDNPDPFDGPGLGSRWPLQEHHLHDVEHGLDEYVSSVSPSVPCASSSMTRIYMGIRGPYGPLVRVYLECPQLGAEVSLGDATLAAEHRRARRMVVVFSPGTGEYFLQRNQINWPE